MPDIARYDVFDVSKAAVDKHGWLRDIPVMTRAGIFTYRNADGTFRKEYRPPEEVFAPESLASLKGVPAVMGHNGLVTDQNPDHEIVGSVVSEGRREREDSLNLVGELVVHNLKRVGQHREVSLGYTITRLDQTPGEVNGERYDAIQRGIRYNHLAFVRSGRAGNARIRLDADDAYSGDLSVDEDPEDMADANLKTVRVDGLDYKASPEVERHIQKLEADLQKANTRADSMEAERDELKDKLQKSEDQIEKVRQDAVASVRGRLELEGKAKLAGVAVDAKDTDRQIREKVLKKVKGENIRLDGKTDDYVTAAFDMATESLEVTAKTGKSPSASSTRQDAIDAEGPVLNTASRAKQPSSSRDFRRAMMAGIGREASNT